MRLQLDGTETLADIREAIRHLATLKTRVGNRLMRRALDAQIDELLDAELRMKQEARRRPGDC